MVREFKLPDVGEGVAEGEIVGWLVEEGDTVSEDQPVAEVETDKAIVEVPSPVNGTVREILAEEGEMVPVGNVIITFNVEGEDDLEGTGSAETEEPTESQKDTTEEPEVSEDEGEAESAGTGGRVFAAPSARRLARELGVDIAAVEGTGPSGRVTEGDVRNAAKGGEEAEAEEETESTSEPAEAGGEAAAGGQPAGQAAERGRTLAAPATRKLAEEKGVDLNAVPASEERDGEAFVTAEAVTQYAESQQQVQAQAAGALAAGETGPREEREPFRGVRKTISEQMARSKYTAPHVTHHDEVDVTELVETRTELKEVAEERGIRLTYMPFVMKAVTAALKEFPHVNSSLDEENEELVLKNYYNVGVATATDAGLMVPVVKDADRKGLLQLSSEMNELVAKARDRSISMDEMQGGTFTITNIGGIGGEYATPIINYPEVAILALGEIKEKPRVVDGEIVPRKVMTVSLSFDHRVIDGAVGARFTNEVLEYLENPKLLLLD